MIRQYLATTAVPRESSDRLRSWAFLFIKRRQRGACHSLRITASYLAACVRTSKQHIPVTRQKARFDGVKPVLDGGRHASPDLMRRRARMEAACRDAGG